MNITFAELRDLKHSLPTGSIDQIAKELNIEAQTVRNYFGAKKYSDGRPADFHLTPGPSGGIIHLHNTAIYEKAQEIISQSSMQQATA